MMEDFVVISEGIEATHSKGVISVSKAGKTNSKIIDHPLVVLSVKDGKVHVTVKGDSRNHKKLLNTAIAHIKNLIAGLNNDYIYNLKICSSHFPMDVSVKDNEIIVKNFLGERKNRVAKIMPSTKVTINNDTIIVSSHNKEFAGQTAANIEMATRLSNKDRRKFQDGIYMTVKAGEAI